ncbi:MAG: HD domain-containing protein [Bacilli bacterium]|nr:HD domain-containing protein [Bacilli bacterium]
MDYKIETINKTKKFEVELEYIKEERIQNSAKALIELIPNYFFEEGASSTGKYHPSFSQGKGGLLRHTKAAVRIAKEILSTTTFGDEFTKNEQDLIYVAIMMHDTVKRGNNEKYTRFDHPLLSSQLIKNNKNLTKLTEEEINLICDMIETHMGEWTTDYFGKEILKKPTTKYQKIVHLCDYLSSKKFLDIKFDENDNIIY